MNHPTQEAITVNDTAIEQEIQAKGFTAPRVTLADLQANIVSEHYFTAQQGDSKAVEDAAFSGGALNAEASRATPDALRLLTFCVLLLRNGFTVTGESACASPENFDAEIGRKIARDNAVQKVWPLMGYALKQQLHVAETGPWPCKSCRDAFPAGDSSEPKPVPVQAAQEQPK